MPAFGTIPAPSLTVGDSVALVNDASTDSGVTFTQAIVLAQIAGTSTGAQLTLQNTSNQTATVYVAAQDFPAATGNYSPLTNADFGEAITCPSNETIVFTTPGPFVCCHYASSPTSGSLIIAR